VSLDQEVPEIPLLLPGSPATPSSGSTGPYKVYNFQIQNLPVLRHAGAPDPLKGVNLDKVSFRKCLKPEQLQSF
jgi:hypothetical protein